MENIEKTNNYPNAKGYSIENKISLSELKKFKNAINHQWLNKIKENNPPITDIAIEKGINIQNYHKISSFLKHDEIWIKSNRILPSNFSNWFLESEFAKNLKNSYGEFTISDEDNMGWPNIIWRLVRPGQASDVGPLHRDSWFWKLNKNRPKPKYNFSRLKVWIPIYTEKGFNGLLVEPYSHKRQDIRWTAEFRHGIRKPVLNTPSENFKPILLDTKDCDTVVFNDNLIHGGALNRGVKCRVSVEFTMLIKEV